MPENGSKYESLTPCHVLICEDQSDNLMLIQHLVSSFGCTASIARNGSEAIAHSMENRFDAILMDLAMPEVSGLEAAKQIRATPNPNHKTPIIAVTAEISEIVSRASVSFGIDDYITKPIDAQLLYNTIKQLRRLPSEPST